MSHISPMHHVCYTMMLLVSDVCDASDASDHEVLRRTGRFTSITVDGLAKECLCKYDKILLLLLLLTRALVSLM